jgi:hypothetical protein
MVTIFFALGGTGLVLAQTGSQWEESQTDLVARISYMEGQLERYAPQTHQWEALVADAPVGGGDQLYAPSNSRSEILIPNETMLRIGGETRLHLVSMSAAATVIDLSFGKTRLYNQGDRTEVTVETTFGQLVAPPGAIVDLSVTDTSVEITALGERAYFTHARLGVRQEVVAHSASLVAATDTVSLAHRPRDNGWEAWNREQDGVWAERNHFPGPSKTYLPDGLHTDAHVLDRYGTWERVYYDGGYYPCWRPGHVTAAWTPFSVGIWTVWRGDRVWLPHEPFGYVTHHYGNWIHVNSAWYWAPPVTRVMVRTGPPMLRIGFGWYPGRVAWVSGGLYSSWIPLAPYEPFYSRHPWGRRSIARPKGHHPNHPGHLHRYKHHRHSVRVHRDHVFRKRHHGHGPKKAYGPKRHSDRFNGLQVLHKPKPMTIRHTPGKRPDKMRHRPANIDNRPLKKIPKPARVDHRHRTRPHVQPKRHTTSTTISRPISKPLHPGVIVRHKPSHIRPRPTPSQRPKTVTRNRITPSRIKPAQRERRPPRVSVNRPDQPSRVKPAPSRSRIQPSIRRPAVQIRQRPATPHHNRSGKVNRSIVRGKRF